MVNFSIRSFISSSLVKIGTTVVFIVVTSLVLFAGNAEPATTQHQSESRLFSVHLPKTIDPTYLSINYFLTGSFGGYGGFVRTKPNTWDYKIETSIEGEPARALKAIIFCPGYEMKLVDFPSLDDSSIRNAKVELTPLPQIRLSGRVVLPKTPGVRDLRIEASYLASWAHEFFGIADGMVSTFTVASADMADDGSFSTAVPDFAHDSSINAFRVKGTIRLTLREANTGHTYSLGREKGSRGDAEIEVAAEYTDKLILYTRTRPD